MARYGDILEINGQLVEFTPVGYVPVKGREGMLTKPAPTTKQTGPVGTPSSPPKQMPGESGPFDPNAPVPAPAPAPQQTAPVGTPSSDPTKRQPGETGPFDPNAEPPAPAPAPEPEAELAPPKPLPDTKDAEPAPEPEGVTTFTFFKGDETGVANPAALYDRGDSTQLTQAELQEYFSDEGSGMLREAFGTFNNYLAYMTEREQLIQSGDYDVGNWDEYTGALTEDELMLLEGEDLTQYGDDAASDMPELEQRRLLEQSSAYDRWINSEANQALLEKYGVGSTIYNQDGDKYEWNGSAYVKTVKVDDHAGVGDYVKAGILAAMNYFAGGALTDALVSTGMSATLASGTSAGILNAATQYAATGEVDFGDALDSAISAGLSTEIINQLTEAGVFDQLEESLNNLTQDTVQLADGTELPLDGNLVTLADGTTVNYSDFITQTAEAGNAVVAEINRSLPEFLSTIADAFEDSGAAQGVVNVIEGMTTETQPYPGSESPQVAVNIPSGGRDIFAGDAEQVEQVEEPEEVPPEEDILADTTQEATGFEDSVVRELLDEYIQPVLASLEDQDLETAGIQTAIGTLTEQQQETLQEFVRQGGQIEELDSNQQQIIEDLGGVNEVVSDLAENVSGLEEGLQQAETEREDIRASQEAGFIQAEQDRQRLMEAIVEARGQTTELSQEMRDLLAQSNQTMQEMFEGTGVDIDELRSGQLSQEEATNALREYTQQEFGAVREELAAGLTEAQQERYELAQDLIEVGGLVENLDAASQERFDELDITVDTLAEEFGVDFDRLEQGLLSAEEATDALQTYAEEEFGAVREDIAGLEERIDANTAQQLEELTGLRAEFLQTLSASEAAAIARNQGLSDQLTEQITGVRGETAAQIEGINNRLTDRIDAYEQQTGEQLDIAAEERAELGGQLGTLTTDVARVAEDVIRAGGRIEELDEASRQRYEELGLSIDELSLRVGVNLNALSEGMLTQDAALRELIEETTQQTEQSLTERLEEAEQGFATSLSDTEANLLSQITGVESGVLQQLAEVEGGLQSQFGEQFDVVQQQVSGLGEQVTGLGEGITGLGQALGVGLLGLAAAQPTAQEIASAMPRQPVKFDPFLKGLSPFQPLTPIALAPQKQTDALSELNKFIGRQTGMLV